MKDNGTAMIIECALAAEGKTRTASFLGSMASLYEQDKDDYWKVVASPPRETRGSLLVQVMTKLKKDWK